jgi:hypothetical protein
MPMVAGTAPLGAEGPFALGGDFQIDGARQAVDDDRRFEGHNGATLVECVAYFVAHAEPRKGERVTKRRVYLCAPMSTSNEIDSESLRREARAAANRAYAPDSSLRVGAAALCGDGRLVVGSNVENASYGLTLCAECSLGL